MRPADRLHYRACALDCASSFDLVTVMQTHVCLAAARLLGDGRGLCFECWAHALVETLPWTVARAFVICYLRWLNRRCCLRAQLRAPHRACSVCSVTLKCVPGSAHVAPPIWPQCLQALSAIAGKLAALHEAGWVHRDLKPGNILRMPALHSWTLIDFGCAAHTGALFGTAPLGVRLSLSAVLLLGAWAHDSAPTVCMMCTL